LKQKHTRTHMRQRVFSELASQPTQAGGYRDPIEAAREKVGWILENHHPEPLDEAVQAEFKRILAAAERELS
jgi:trimethylamine:corrinoid methyltransferase-like protein